MNNYILKLKGYYSGSCFMGWDPFELRYKEFNSDKEYYDIYENKED